MNYIGIGKTKGIRIYSETALICVRADKKRHRREKAEFVEWWFSDNWIEEDE